ncbi:MAG: type II toxin-antitoxin system YafQ family toxin [Candidatus Caenarcaniphilales bacterium]|nr:type II toxin-antitoxin system YafQ family toxin [Candidatus Caenarcaniphilales bacterium]
MYTPHQTSQYKSDIKKIKRQGKNLNLLKQVVSLLLNGETLPEKYKDHELKSNKKGIRDCHLEPDWLLLYRIDKAKKALTLIRTGSHSELFKKK